MPGSRTSVSVPHTGCVRPTYFGSCVTSTNNWAEELRAALHLVYHHRKAGTLTQVEKTAFLVRFDALLEAGLISNPTRKQVLKQRGWVKQFPGRNLALPCQKHRDKVLCFLNQNVVPFGNNQAERDIRVVYVKRKISGSFCSDRRTDPAGLQSRSARRSWPL